MAETPRVDAVYKLYTCSGEAFITSDKLIRLVALAKEMELETQQQPVGCADG